MITLIKYAAKNGKEATGRFKMKIEVGEKYRIKKGGVVFIYDESEDVYYGVLMWSSFFGQWNKDGAHKFEDFNLIEDAIDED